MLIQELLTLERSVDPVALGQRAGQRYGQRTRYGHWEPPVKGEHIPLTSFNSRRAEAVDKRRYSIINSLGHTAGEDPAKDRASLKRYFKLFALQTMPIQNLTATQPFVRVDDVDRLRNKLEQTTPDNVRVARYRGVDYILDGHHSVMAARLRGDREIPVQFADFDSKL